LDVTKSTAAPTDTRQRDIESGVEAAFALHAGRYPLLPTHVMPFVRRSTWTEISIALVDMAARGLLRRTDDGYVRAGKMMATEQ
jgi:hypothetical protein